VTVDELCTWLDVDDNYLTASGVALLTGAFEDLYVGTQRSDEGNPDNRIASACE
jgi:hypothetical protein